MDQIVAIFNFESAGVDLPPEELKLMGYYEPEKFDLERLEDGFTVTLEERSVEILTTLQALYRNNLPALREEADKKTADWWKKHSDQVNSYYKTNWWLNLLMYRAVMRGE